MTVGDADPNQRSIPHYVLLDTGHFFALPTGRLPGTANLDLLPSSSIGQRLFPGQGYGQDGQFNSEPSGATRNVKLSRVNMSQFKKLVTASVS